MDGNTQSKRRRVDDPSQQLGAAGEKRAVLRGKLTSAFQTTVTEAFQDLEQECLRADEQAGEARARLLAEAQHAAAKVKKDATSHDTGMRRELQKDRAALQKDRAALEEERVAMEKTHTFQTNKILLDVGGHKFTTSLDTLTSVPDTYFASVFSGRFPLTLDADGAYCIDRDGVHFRHILNHLRSPGRYTLSSDVTEGQKDELAVELEFYGLLDHMMPYHASERVGQGLLRRACFTGTKAELQTAVAQASTLIFEFGSTTPFLNDKFQDLRFVITDRVLHGSPVWAAAGCELFMYHNRTPGFMSIGDAAQCERGASGICIGTKAFTGAVLTPTDLLTHWLCTPQAVMEAQYATAKPYISGCVYAPTIRITAVHGLDGDDPAMVAALRQLAALA
jgi:hypothetical protein